MALVRNFAHSPVVVAPSRHIAPVDAIVARIAARQLGLFLRSQAHESGMTDAMIEYRVRVGRWIVVSPGLYRLAGVPVTWSQRALAACMVSGTGAVVSHRSAAVLWGVSGFRPGPLDITVRRGGAAGTLLPRCTGRRSTVCGGRGFR